MSHKRFDEMRALVWLGPRQMTLQKVAVPAPAPEEALVRVDAVGICGSELSGYLGHNSLRKPPLVMGHEFAGTVAVTGGHAGTMSEGDKVIVNPLISCGSCRACRDGSANLCPSRELIGAHRPGAFAEYVTVPTKACHRVPDSMPAPLAAMAEPLACAVRAVRLAGIRLGQHARVIGAGPIGLLCALLIKRSGASVLIVEKNAARIDVARTWGVDGIDPDEHEELQSQGQTPDAVIDAVGLESTRKTAIRTVARGGTVVFVGLHNPAASFDGNELVRNEVSVCGSFAYAPADFATACGLLETGLLPDTSSWMSVRPLEAGPEGFDELVGSTPSILKIVLQP